MSHRFESVVPAERLALRPAPSRRVPWTSGERAPGDSDDLRERRLRARMWLAAPLLFLVFALARAGDGYTPQEGDYAQYLSHARALAEGAPYTDIGYLYSTHAASTGPRAYPPGLAYTVAPLVDILGSTERSVHAVEGVVLVFAVAFVALIARYFALRTSPEMGLLVGLVAGLSPGLLGAATKVGADLPFCALVWAVIVLADLGDERGHTWSPRHTAAIALLGSAAILYRTVGVALIPAAALYGLLHLRRRGLAALTVVAVWTVVFLGENALLPIVSSYRNEMTLTPTAIAGVILKNFSYYRYPVMEGLFYPFATERANTLYHGVVMIPLAVGLVAWLRTSYRDFLAVFSVAYVVVLLPFHAVAARYAWPLYPVLAFGVLNGAGVIGRWVADALRRRRAPAAGPAKAGWRRAPARVGPLPRPAVLGRRLAALALVAAAAAWNVRAGRAVGLTERADVRALFDYVRHALPARASRVAFVNPRVLTWETRVPAMSLVDAPGDTVAVELARQGITHVVIGSVDPNAPSDCALRSVIRGDPADFTAEYVNRSFAVYRVLPSFAARVRARAPAGGEPSRRIVPAPCPTPRAGAGALD
jgi:hypothetical protein